MLRLVYDHKIRLIADKSLTNRATEVVGDHMSKFGHSKIDGHVQNYGPVNTKRKR